MCQAHGILGVQQINVGREEDLGHFVPCTVQGKGFQFQHHCSESMVELKHEQNEG